MKAAAGGRCPSLAGKEALRAQQVGQGNAPETAPRLPEEAAAVEFLFELFQNVFMHKTTPVGLPIIGENRPIGKAG